MHVLPSDAIHSAVFAVVRCLSIRLSVTLVYCGYRVETAELTIKLFIAWWSHHSSFSIVKFRWSHPQQGRQIEVGY